MSGLLAWTLRPKQSRLKIGDKVSPRKELLLELNSSPKSRLVTPSMHLILIQFDDYTYYFEVRPNENKLWSEKPSNVAKKGDIVEVDKNNLKHFKTIKN